MTGPWVSGESLSPSRLNLHAGAATLATGFSTDTLQGQSGLTVNVLSDLSVQRTVAAQREELGGAPSSTSAMLSLRAHSQQSDYLFFQDAAALKSNFILGLRTGDSNASLVDGLNLYDASDNTMIVRFSSDSVRFYPPIIAPVFDTGGALASTYNAALFLRGGSKESQIQAAITAAAADGIKRVYVPANLYPYSAASVSFDTRVQMVREGGNWGEYDVQAYGAAGDMIQDDTDAFRSAISGAAPVSGVVRIPASISSKYRMKSTLTLPVNISLTGDAGFRPILRYNGSPSGTLFAVLGTSESQEYSVTLAHLTLESATNRSGVGIRLRNFSDVFLRNVLVSNWSDGLWADWGQALYIYDCEVSTCSFGIKLGGAGAAGGIRSGNTDFLDWVHIQGCRFSQNQVDIEHKGSHAAHGVLSIEHGTFFESGAAAVSNKTYFVAASGLKSFVAKSNAWESPFSRACISLSSIDLDGTSQGSVMGGLIAGNEFLLNGGSGTTGIWVRAAQNIAMVGNAFESQQNTAVAHDVADPSNTNWIGPSFYSGGASLSAGTSRINMNWGQMLFGGGNQLAPPISFSSEASLGFYRSNTSTIADSYQQLFIRGGTGVGINVNPTAATLEVAGTGKFTSALRGFDGTAVTPMFAYTSETSLGWYRSGVSTVGLSYGSLNLNQARLVSVRTQASLDSTSLATNEMAFQIVAGSVATLAIRSGGTIYYFASSASTKG